ncbi:hypothetical protein G8759_17255 [Spirosoma aureum]|uniref:Uncharacterized protein n=1 Tax=Spirosoma aureum TaxID=2692134 RepID=A0A6G9APH0_9BACT|nr:hypothetical protein [Spirosoma aureum]QIP14236.1 hypothetical protein G8759_17255 [Spirosoma aureum]
MYTENRNVCSYSGDAGPGGSYYGIYIADQSILPRYNLLTAIKSTSTLTPTQERQLEEALNDFVGPCLNTAIYKIMVAKGQMFNFRIDPSVSYPANYNPFNNNLTFQSAANIDQPDFLREELFHGYQNSFYENKTSQYANTGKSNIEFEAKLYKDLLSVISGSGGSFTGVTFSNNWYDSYVQWIKELTDSFTKYPSVINMDKYNFFLE